MLLRRAQLPTADRATDAARSRAAEQRLEWQRRFGCRRLEVREPWLTCVVPFERGAPDWASVGPTLERLAAETRPVHARVSAARAEAERRFADGKGGLTMCADGTGLELVVHRGGARAEALDLTPCGAMGEPMLAELERRAWHLFEGVLAAARR
jgi:hypothetical protein